MLDTPTKPMLPLLFDRTYAPLSFATAWNPHSQISVRRHKKCIASGPSMKETNQGEETLRHMDKIECSRLKSNRRRLLANGAPSIIAVP